MLRKNFKPKFLLKSTQKAFVKGIREKLKNKYQHFQYTSKKGYDLLHDPILNKTCAFTYYERQQLHLRGLLPQKILTLEEQENIQLEEFQHGMLQLATLYPDEETSKIGVTPDMIRKAKVLSNIQELDNTLYYDLIISKFSEFLPIFYTPTVGWFCKNFSKLFRKPRGTYISHKDRGQIHHIIHNNPLSEVQACILSDGSKILSLGDWGIGSQPIVVGKKDLYVAVGGFDPWRVLPIVLDVGTNNQQLKEDPYYLGTKNDRIRGREYYEFMDELMDAIESKYSNVFYHFEDVELKHGLKIVRRYQDENLVFNDCISGTASTILAGILSALKVQKRQKKSITELKFFVVGAGNAGMGIVNNLHQFLQKYGLTYEQATRQIFIFDIDGLITKARPHLHDRIKAFARDDEGNADVCLEEMTARVRPNVLIGCSGQEGLFNQKVLSGMQNVNKGFAPLIFALSNPTSKAECTAEEAQKFTKNRAFFSSGSPFEDVVVDGQEIKSNLANNSYIVPGLAFGCSVGQIDKVHQELILAAAESLSDLMTKNHLFKRQIYPDIDDLREVSAHVAASVLRKAYSMDLIRNRELLDRLDINPDFGVFKDFVLEKQWKPVYKPLVSVH